MPRAKTDTAPALAAAYAKLVAAGRPVTVRALRETAAVGTDAAAVWLRENAPAPEVPPAPVDALAPALATVWAVAWGQATDVVAEEHAAALAAAREAEAHSLTIAETAEQAAEQRRQQAADLAATVEDRDRAIAGLRADLTGAQQALDELRRRLHEAERAQAAAQATAETLRDTLAGFQDAARRRPTGTRPRAPREKP